MKLTCSFKRWNLVLFLLFMTSVATAEVDSGYEAANNIDGTCPTNANKQPDAWGFAACNCTSYVAYRLNWNNVQHNGVPFGNTAWVGAPKWGNAGLWNNEAKLKNAGVQADNYPAVGSVAYWSTHVAYTQHLFTNPNDGRLTSIGIMEYNYDSFQYTYRRIGVGRGTGSVGGYPSSFLHFEEKGRDADNTNVTCVAGLPSTSRPGGASAGSFCWRHNSNGDANCSNASAYYYFDYQNCQKYTVSNSYCDAVGTNPGYTAHIGNWFPEPIDSNARGNDFATCDSTGSVARGNSREVSGRLPAKRMAFLRKTILND